MKMREITLERDRVYCGNLILVNAFHPIRNVDENDLAAASARFPDILLKRKAADALRLALEEIGAGDSIVPVSGYRSLEEQTAIYEGSLRENGEEFTGKYVALPNHSEHQTGLAVDLGLNKGEIDFIRPDFPYEGMCEEFRRVAPAYGFVERYGRTKEKITGISHEPWHFRYVGRPHAEIIAKRDFALEEYAEFIRNYGMENAFVCEWAGGTRTEVYYVPADRERKVIYVPRNMEYQISGDNMGGFIVTVCTGFGDGM